MRIRFSGKMLSLTAHLKELKTWQSFVMLSGHTPVYREKETDKSSDYYFLKICELKFFKLFQNRHFNVKDISVTNIVLNKEGRSEGIRLSVKRLFNINLDIELTPCINGRIQGVKMIFRNGGLYFIGRYINNFGEGHFFYYYPNGVVKSKELYVNDEQEGEATYYYDTGYIRRVSHFHRNKLHGETTQYYVNGKVKEKGLFKDGGRIGEHIIYHQDGRISHKEFYDERRRDRFSLFPG